MNQHPEVEHNQGEEEAGDKGLGLRTVTEILY
jgi:hypothetical protein